MFCFGVVGCVVVVLWIGQSGVVILEEDLLDSSGLWGVVHGHCLGVGFLSVLGSEVENV